MTVNTWAGFWASVRPGSDAPGRYRSRLVLFLVPLVALAACGMFNHFHPDDRFGTWMWWPAILVCVPAWSWFCFQTARGLNPYFEGSRWRLLWMWPFGSAMFSVFAWLALADGLPGIWTRWLGQPFIENVEVTTHYSHSRRSCDYKIRSIAFGKSLGNTECIRESYYRAHPEQSMHARLSGKRSMFGITVQRLQDVSGTVMPGAEG